LALAAILRHSRVTMADSIGWASFQIAGLRPSLKFPPTTGSGGGPRRRQAPEPRTASLSVLQKALRAAAAPGARAANSVTQRVAESTAGTAPRCSHARRGPESDPPRGLSRAAATRGSRGLNSIRRSSEFLEADTERGRSCLICSAVLLHRTP